MEPGEFFTMPNEAVDRMAEVPSLVFAVYCALERHANSKRECFPSIKRLCSLTGATKRAVTNAVSTLVKIGWIERTSRFKDDGSQTSNFYRLLLPRGPGEQEAPPGMNSGAGGGCTKGTGGGCTKGTGGHARTAPRTKPIELNPGELNPGNGEQGETRRDDHISSSWKKWEEVEGDVQRLSIETKKKIPFADKTGRTKQGAADRNLRVKVCYLVAAGRMPEHWLRDATEAVIQGKHKTRAAAYWQTCLARHALKMGENLNALLIECNHHIPAEVLQGERPKQRQAQ
jgi:hypothetical protein